ncbi:MAG TPA: chemotaxis protein CheW [Stellaceae bacterium]|jgi:chemotaxis signal transduction protein|nr:chemotaxis protein CheW [Stellaceae bacterium]
MAAASGVGANPQMWLLCRAGTRLCALAITHVVETMRMPPLEPFLEAPDFIAGLAVVHGDAVPVIATAQLLGGEKEDHPQRLVTIDVGSGRLVALAVTEVIGVHAIASELQRELPTLLRDAAHEAVQALQVRDNELMLFLNGGKLIPESLLDRLDAQKLQT